MPVVLSDSPMCITIVLAFLDFLSSVTPVAGVDPEALIVIQECLRKVFCIDQSSGGDEMPRGFLINLFSSLADDEQINDLKRQILSLQGASSCESSSSDGSSSSTESVVKDLFRKYFRALAEARFFRPSPTEDGNTRVNKGRAYFEDAIEELKNACQPLTMSNLTQKIISQGGLAMAAQQFTKAVDLYTIAIALSEDNKQDIQYCNRAAANFGKHKYTAALFDCTKAMEINPKCIEAYNVFGHIRFAQGNIIDALCNGFVKVLQLDPDNERAQANIQLCEDKLREKFRKMRDQNEALANMIKEPFLPLRSGREAEPKVDPDTVPWPLQSVYRNPTDEAESSAANEMEHLEEVLALLSLASSGAKDPSGSKP